MRNVGLIVDCTGGFGREVLRGIMRYVQSAGDWNCILPPMHSFMFAEGIDLGRVDGVIVQVQSAAQADRLAAAGAPVVNVSGSGPGERFPSVRSDEEAIGRMAFEYFQERGFRHYAFFGAGGAGWSKGREAGFSKAAAEAGHPCEVRHGPGDPPADWLGALPKPVALLGGNDVSAWHALNACRQAGIRVPDEVALLGVDDDELVTKLMRPTLSSVITPGVQIGHEAAALLDGLMAGGRPPAGPRLMGPVGVATRESTDVLHIDDPAVAAALRGIRARATEALGVDELLGPADVSRRTLERRFRRILNRSPLQEIRRVRVERAKQLLRETDLSIPEVAWRSGFRERVRFAVAFRQSVGLTPTAYRRQFRVFDGVRTQAPPA